MQKELMKGEIKKKYYKDKLILKSKADVGEGEGCNKWVETG